MKKSSVSLKPFSLSMHSKSSGNSQVNPCAKGSVGMLLLVSLTAVVLALLIEHGEIPTSKLPDV